MRALALAGLFAASCGGPSGVLVVSSWGVGPVASLMVETIVNGGAPTAQVLPGPMESPYRLLIKSPSDLPLVVHVVARDPMRDVADGELGLTPAAGQILKVALQLEPIPMAVCGDGKLDNGEECDDGNREERDDCTAACTCARCGDGVVHLFTSGMPSGSCPAADLEECDDGNNVAGDGCSPTCKRE